MDRDDSGIDAMSIDPDVWEVRALDAMKTLLEAYDQGDLHGINDTLTVMQNLIAEKEELGHAG